MTINLTELRDEPLGKHPIQAAVCSGFCVFCRSTYVDQQDVVAADDESVFKFDFEGIGDEALDDSPSVSAFPCLPSNYCGLSDEALDPRPAVNAFGCATGCMYEPQTQP